MLAATYRVKPGEATEQLERLFRLATSELLARVVRLVIHAVINNINSTRAHGTHASNKHIHTYTFKQHTTLTAAAEAALPCRA